MVDGADGAAGVVDGEADGEADGVVDGADMADMADIG